MTLTKTFYGLASAAALLSHSVSAGSGLPMASKVTIKDGAGDGTMAKNGDLPVSFTVHNTAKSDARWVCWKDVAATASNSADVKTNTPIMNDVIPAGQTHTYSAQHNAVIDCVPVYPNTQQSVAGTLVNTLFSFSTMSPFGVFYVDGAALPAGDNISAKSDDGCTSDHDNCSWECADPKNNCMGPAKQTECTGPGSIPAVDGNGGCMWKSGKVALTLSNNAKNATSSASS